MRRRYCWPQELEVRASLAPITKIPFQYERNRSPTQRQQRQSCTPVWLHFHSAELEYWNWQVNKRWLPGYVCFEIAREAMQQAIIIQNISNLERSLVSLCAAINLRYSSEWFEESWAMESNGFDEIFSILCADRRWTVAKSVCLWCSTKLHIVRAF